MRTLFRVGAILFYQGKLVTTKMKKGDKEYHVVPGGGVESEETIEQALVRELKEELKIEAKEFRLIAIRELNVTNHGRGIEFYYFISSYDGIPTKGHDPEKKDASLEGLGFIELSNLESYNLVPSQLVNYLKKDRNFKEVKHLGLYPYP